jgi:outer membrane protein assembly factor BamB
MDRRTLRRRPAVALLAVLGAVTLTGSVIPRSHGARLLWTIPYTDQAFGLTGDSLYLQADTDGWSLRAYELADGSLRWTKQLAGPASIRLSAAGDVLLPVGVRVGAPGGDDGNAAGRLTRATVALDAATGTERWRVTGEVAFSRGERAVVVDRYRRTGDLAALTVVRLTDGGTVWTRAVDAELQWTADDDNLLTVAPDGLARVFRLADGAEVATGQVGRRPGTADSGAITGAQIHGDMIYISRYETRPSVTAYSLPTMRRRWSIETDGGGLNDCGTVFCSSTGRETVAHDRKTGAVRWRSAEGTSLWPIAPGRLAMATDEPLAERALADETSGRTLARLGRGTLLTSSPDDGRSDRPVYFLRNTVEPADRVSVSRLDPATGRLSLLGAIDQGLRDRCQASGTRVVCPRTNSTLSVIDVG